MGDALVAIDTGLATVDGLGMPFAGPVFLNREVHIVEVMTVSAFAAVGLLHDFPDIPRQFQSLGLKLLGCINGAQEVVV